MALVLSMGTQCVVWCVCPGHDAISGSRTRAEPHAADRSIPPPLWYLLCPSGLLNRLPAFAVHPKRSPTSCSLRMLSLGRNAAQSIVKPAQHYYPRIYDVSSLKALLLNLTSMMPICTC